MSRVRGPHGPASGWLWPLVAVALVVLFCLGLLWQDPQRFWNDDYQAQYLPAFEDVARAWAEGELPLLSPYAWSGGALAGEYQYGTFSLFVNLCVVLVWRLGLGFAATAASISLVHLAVLAGGVFVLARRRGLPAELALTAALAASLNGWVIVWAAGDWVPALTSFAWVPWAWYGLERAAEGGRWRFLPAGVFVYLVLAAGWPYSVLMLVLVTAFVAARCAWRERRIVRLWPLAAAWLLGAALAMPALLMLIEYFQATTRTGMAERLHWQWVVPPAALLGLVHPAFDAEWFGWGGSHYPRPSLDLYGGAVPPIVLLIAFARRPRTFSRKVAWELALLALVLALAMLPSMSVFRYSFRWLPLFHLVLGILGAEALAHLRRLETEAAGAASRPGLLGRLRLSTVLVAILALHATSILFAIQADLIRYLDATSLILGLATFPLLCAAGWLLVKRSTPAIERWLPAIVLLVGLWFGHSVVSERPVKRWSLPEAIRSAEPFDPSVLYLGFYTRPETFEDPEAPALIRPGNTPMHAPARWVNGYSPMPHAGFREILGIDYIGYFQESTRLIERETGPDGLLELMAVDGLVVSAAFSDHLPGLEARGWRTVAGSERATVLHRRAPSPRVRAVRSVELAATRREIVDRLVDREEGPVPLLLLAGDGERRAMPELGLCRLELVEESRRRLAVEVEPVGGSSSLVVFSRPWYPGYRARLDGRPVPVYSLNLMLPAVELPPGGAGTLVLEYRPLSLVVGSAVAAAALLGLAVAAAGGLVRRRRSPPTCRGGWTRTRAPGALCSPAPRTWR